MINLQTNTVNNFVIYADTISSEVQTYGDFFLIGFKNTYSNHWHYVIPNLVKRNSRFVQLSFTPLQQGENDDPYNATLTMAYPGTWEYKVYNIFVSSLDPSAGILIDQGDSQLEPYTPNEVQQVTYVSDNESFLSVVYYSGQGNTCIIDYSNSPYIISIPTVNTCQPLEITETGYVLIKAGQTLTLTS